MKALGASVLLIALLSVATPVGANSIYMGTLAADQSYSIHVDNGLISAGKTIVTVYYLTGRGAIKFNILTVAAGERQTSVQVIPRGTLQIAIEAAPPRNTTVNVEATQGFLSFTQACVDGCTMVFDLQ